ncbi:hypothetical protein GWI33_017113 [Rhynchophorus ferrugineus]|uniref:Reverse transcriptase domain-containing protein n=1 Tax=Rhynchophorus ferrugineus TaxID=354439 RepID=A0A834HZN8_RHYFE|nr:hypothetical protein GWI33_017113 [Rhynchophorus ferrugineus]
MYRVKQEKAYFTIKEAKAGVPQGNVLGRILYLLYTCDIPQMENITIATFADDTAIIAVGDNSEEASRKFQQASDNINNCTQAWKIRINESKSVHVQFTYKQIAEAPIKLNNTIIPYSNNAKYLGMNLNAKLRWKEHIKKKRK